MRWFASPIDVTWGLMDRMRQEEPFAAYILEQTPIRNHGFQSPL